MPKIVYERTKFGLDRLEVIRMANEILEEYVAQGYDLTLRQLYYQFVARGLIPNSDREYKNLGATIGAARMAGKIDWDHIVDRTRYLREVSTWSSPSSIVRSAATGYQRDLWAEQDTRVEVWIEKDALVGVVERACEDLRVPFLSCRGYTSSTEMWGAAQRFYGYARDGKKVRILHLGDHDPSGIDMSRDIEERIFTFMASDFYREQAETALDLGGLSDASADILVEESTEWTKQRFKLDRLALNWDQVQQYNPPPNPAKLTDSRGRGYVAEYGRQSWELDALEPTVIGDLIRNAVEEIRDPDLWSTAVEVEDRERLSLSAAANRWPEVVDYLGEKGE